MQRNPAYGIPSEITRTVRHEHTVPNAVRENDHGRPQHSTNTRQAIPKLSIFAIVLSTIALVAALVCFILTFTQGAEKRTKPMLLIVSLSSLIQIPNVYKVSYLDDKSNKFACKAFSQLCSQP